MKSPLHSRILIASIMAMTPFQKDLHGTCQRSLLEIPPKPETDAWYATRAQEKRNRKALRRPVPVKKGSK